MREGIVPNPGVKYMKTWCHYADHITIKIHYGWTVKCCHYVGNIITRNVAIIADYTTFRIHYGWIHGDMLPLRGLRGWIHTSQDPYSPLNGKYAKRMQNVFNPFQQDDVDEEMISIKHTYYNRVIIFIGIVFVELWGKFNV